jgi:hypothetical protein
MVWPAFTRIPLNAKAVKVTDAGTSTLGTEVKATLGYVLLVGPKSLKATLTLKMDIPLELTTAPLRSVQTLKVKNEEEVVKVPEDSTSKSLAMIDLPETSNVAPFFTRML